MAEARPSLWMDAILASCLNVWVGMDECPLSKQPGLTCDEVLVLSGLLLGLKIH